MLNILRRLFPSFFKPAMEMSYSRLNAYRFCPWKYKFIYLDHMHVAPNPATSLGLSIHKALENYYLNAGRSFDDLMESYDKCWVNEGFVSPQQVQDYFEKGQRMLENYWAANKDNDSEVLFLEKEFNFPIGAIRLRGIIDRIDRLKDGSYEVIDYKTHAELWNNARVDADLQISLYALACKKALKIEPGTLSFYFMAHDKKVSTKRTDADINKAVVLVNETAQKILKSEFTPNTANCPKCDFKQMCEYGNPRKRQG